MPSLTDEKLREMATSPDPRAGSRERDAILNVIRPAPLAAPHDLASARAKVAELEAKLAEAKKQPVSSAATGPAQMKNLQATGNIDSELFWTRRRVADFERAERSETPGET